MDRFQRSSKGVSLATLVDTGFPDIVPKGALSSDRNAVADGPCSIHP
jgi:hypothetical protein